MRIAFVVVVCGVVTALGRIGETPDQFAQRYGAPTDGPASASRDKSSPLLEGAVHHHYEYQGWRIRAAFMGVDGPAVRMEYSKTAKTGDMIIHDYEVQAIMTANTPSTTSWKQVSYSNPDSPNKGLVKLAEGFLGNATGQKMWQRSDGAILWARGPLTVRLELPAAREYEAQVKAEKEQKARAAVPKF